MLIIELPLFFAAQAVEGLRDFLESVSCLRCSVLIWVKLESQFLVSLLDLILTSCLWYSQDLIVVALRNDLLALVDLYHKDTYYFLS